MVHTGTAFESRAASGRARHCLSLLVLETVADGSMDMATRSIAIPHLNGCTYCREKLAAIRSFAAHQPLEIRKDAAQFEHCLPSLVLEGVVSDPADFPSDSEASLHVTSCSQCRDKVAMLRAFEARVDAAEREVYGIRRFKLRPVAARLALIAASLFLAVGITTQLRHGTQSAPESPVVYRSLQFRALSPAGEFSSTPEVFRWESVADAASYQLRLMDVDRSAIWSTQTPSTSALIPNQVRQQMTAGRSFLWVVAARNRAGEKVAETSVQHLSISAAKRSLQ